MGSFRNIEPSDVTSKSERYKYSPPARPFLSIFETKDPPALNINFVMYDLYFIDLPDQNIIAGLKRHKMGKFKELIDF